MELSGNTVCRDASSVKGESGPALSADERPPVGYCLGLVQMHADAVGVAKSAN
jgi:hypothetical protein